MFTPRLQTVWLHALANCILLAACQIGMAQSDSLEPARSELESTDVKESIEDSEPSPSPSLEDSDGPLMREPPVSSGKNIHETNLKTIRWKSDDFQHRNLLFEEQKLERNGYTKCPEARQVLHSSTRFFGKSLFLPITAIRGKQWRWQCAPGK